MNNKEKIKKKTRTISASMIIKDEEKHIKDCLESVKGVVDEIIVVHDGPCHDQSLDIVKRYTDKIIISKKNCGCCEPLRHIGIENSSGEWVLLIDADERLSKRLRKKINDLVRNENVDAYSFRWEFYDKNKKKIDNVPRYKTILFRKSKMYKIGFSHMVADTRGKKKRSELVLEHNVISKRLSKKFKDDLRKNIKRAKVTADYMAGPLKNIPQYQCSLKDRSIKQRKKILFIRNFPYIAIFIVPFYTFLDHLLLKRKIIAGLPGIIDSLNIPIYHFLTCYFIIKKIIFNRF